MAEEVLKPTEWEKTFNWVQELLGHQIPWYIKFPLGILVLLALTASVLLILFLAASKIKEIWAEKLIPIPTDLNSGSARGIDELSQDILVVKS